MTERFTLSQFVELGSKNKKLVEKIRRNFHDQGKTIQWQVIRHDLNSRADEKIFINKSSWDTAAGNGDSASPTHYAKILYWMYTQFKFGNGDYNSNYTDAKRIIKELWHCDTPEAAYQQFLEKRQKEVERKTQEEERERQFKEQRKLPPPPLPQPGPSNAPRPPHNFIGRKNELRKIHALLTGGSEAVAIAQSKAGKVAAAVRGLGGVGKSSLARQYADEHRKDYAGIWWCNAEEQKTFLSDIHKLDKVVKIGREDRSDVGWAIELVRGLSERDETHLLIYDNVESPQTIRDLMPGSYARLLITSRFHDWHGTAEVVELDVLPMKEAIAFLKKRAPSVDWAGAEFLATTLGCLPLALEHAAAYCESRKVPFVNYAKEVAQRIAEDSPSSDYPSSVKATFDMAIRRAVELCPEAETLITYLAYCMPDQIPDILVEGAITDAETRGEAVQALRQLSLIKNDPIKAQSPPDEESSDEDDQEPEEDQSPEDAHVPDAIPAWSVHRLVQQVARARSTESAASMLTKIGLHLNRVFPTTGYDSPDDRPLCAALMPHVWPIHAFDKENPDAGDFSTLFDMAGLYLLANANMQAAGEFLKRSLAIRDALPSAEPRELSKSISDLALFLDTDGKWEEAAELCERAFNIRKKAFGIKDKDTLISLNNLACIYMAQDKNAEAYRLFRKSLRFTIEVYTKDHAETAVALDNLSNCSRKLKKLDEALEYCERGIAIKLAEGGEDAEALAASYESLAPIKYDLGRKDEAFEHYAKTEELCAKYYGTDHFATTEARLGMMRIFIERNEFEKAEEKFVLVLSATRKSCGANDDENARVREQYAAMLADAGRPEEARPLLQKAIEIFEANTPKRSPDVRRCRKILKALDARPD